MCSSRNRLIKTLNHQDPGKVVVDLGGTSTTGISAQALIKLYQALGIDKRFVTIDEPFQLLAKVEADLIKALSIDVAPVKNDHNMFGFKNGAKKQWVMPSGQTVLVGNDFNVTSNAAGETFLYPYGDTSSKPCAKMPKNGFYFDNIDHTPDGYAFDENNYEVKKEYAHDFAQMSDEQLQVIKEKADFLYSQTDLGLIGGGAFASIGDFARVSGPNVKNPIGIRNIQSWIAAHSELPEYIKEVFELYTQYSIKNLSLLHEVVGDKIQAVLISGTDFGTQRAQLFSNDMFREIYAPYYKKVNDWVHLNTKWKTFYHTCGAIYPLLDDMHACGMDILNPVQCSAANMEPQKLKREYGDKFVFWGGAVDSQQTLPFGTEQEVYDEVYERLRIFAPGGGFVFSAVHNIQAPTDPLNVLAMFEAVKAYNSSLMMKC